MGVIWVGLGGALGSILRFLLQTRFQAAYPGNFPIGTLGVNLIGSFIIGLLGGWFLLHPVANSVRLFIMVGILGGFTTFSSFALENFILVREGNIRAAVAYVLATNVLGIALACGGFLLSRTVSRYAAGL